ncbi:aminodeoxychorismate synthase component I [Aestuariivirga litoralis]|uniref:aminodeoxychorismate synthase component I n=1 Tax=Aestuariivirga litoralis TaxID=2650924 RepID=UPI0018C52EA1|nr:aminodeoxychorismate synthase component I [Aestuariivirga litoralis]MBG1233619.1 aminodeoxychorismate synthase component I [Aestuariivirga litoralis]
MLTRPHSTPQVTEIAYLEPALYAARLRDQPNLTLLETVMRQEHLGRWSFLACNPSATARALDDVQRDLTKNRVETLPGLPPFQGGWAGFISYDAGWAFQGAKHPPAFKPLCPDMIFHRYDTVLGFDHLQERAFIIGPDAAKLEKLLKRKAPPKGPHVIKVWQSNFTRPDYEAAIARTVEYILAGDIFQANITQCFSAEIPQDFDAFAFYQTLRTKNPATFAAFLDYGDLKVASSSPERLVKMEAGHLEARPIKGTRKRDGDPARDAALIAELQSSRKDRAENVMIVDLLRNDLSRISKPGTVKVPILCGLESYANVHHLVSVVEAEARDGLDAVDLIKAIFPGGSITGAPKIRAMEVIAELEQQARGLYCGGIGWLGFNGNADFNITIRTALFSGGKAYVQGGGGITARSEPAAEYEESLTKISRIMEAFKP